jgi:acyl-CoA thioester hydrolase
MAKVKIIIPPNELATIIVPVRISDINYGNHVGNDAFVSIIHEARLQWLQQQNYSEINIEGVGLIMSDLHIQFKSESFYGDVLIVKIACGEITNTAFELFYELSTKRNNETKTIALASTTMVCYNYQIKKVAPMPLAFKNILSAKS